MTSSNIAIKANCKVKSEEKSILQHKFYNIQKAFRYQRSSFHQL